MREPVAIEYRVFIQIVQRARTHELGNERRLAGEAVAGQHDSVAAKTDDAHMNEGVLCGTFGDPHDEKGLEKLGHGIEWRGAYEPSAVEAKGVKIFYGMLPKRVFRNAGRVRRLSRTTGKHVRTQSSTRMFHLRRFRSAHRAQWRKLVALRWRLSWRSPMRSLNSP